ncbi:pyridoxamine 5'-phosphate oxidase family protein [Pseudooceanicola sp.]|uniref:pyridoxamine 5'-phosphate oxidase family protein n=1 Tax=Pseudooceanicola sp. TaxID=1914328 RepID=UPI0026085621|nr:pyridoxamine 5'-phosphate oxidase family protein [Pseudooceanicola sp.]MDF1854553.1 pyridoxamine 5-phosphate oxidase [Pseudooceanicola sp.]
MAETNPIRQTDDAARALAQALLQQARFAALAVIDPGSGAPMLSRIALATAADGRPLSLLSDLAAHSVALKSNPAASLLVGEPGDKGDPLTHPRLTLQCRVRMVRQDHADHARLSAHYLALRPKAQLYAGFSDFFFALFDIDSAFLNAGFGKAYRLTAADILS